MNSLKNERGGSLIEFVLTAWVLFLVLFGIIEFGLILYNQAVITSASREGARYGIVSRSPRYTEPQIRAYVSQAYADKPITFGTRLFTVDPDLPEGTPIFGDDLTVEVTWEYDFLLLPNFTGVGVLSNPLTLRARTVMKYE
jgi:Flp pilus assembly protein TadG